jgi:hypothetical protein
MKNNLEYISSQLDLLKVLAKSKTKVRQAIIINALKSTVVINLVGHYVAINIITKVITQSNFG